MMQSMWPAVLYRFPTSTLVNKQVPVHDHAPVNDRTPVRNQAPVHDTLQSKMNFGDAPSDFPGHEVESSSRTLVVEENSIARVDAVSLAVIDNDPIRVNLGRSVGGTRIERGCFSLRDFLNLQTLIKFLIKIIDHNNCTPMKY